MAAGDLIRTTFLTVEEAAQLLRLKEATVRGWVRAGKLPAKKPLGGKQVLIEERDLMPSWEPTMPPLLQPLPFLLRAALSS